VSIANVHIVFSLLLLLLFAGMLVLGNRFKKGRKFSPLAGLSAAFIIAGIFFSKSGIPGCGLFAVGVILALGDMVAKARRGRER